jgi:hypothetical protein
MRQTTRWLSAAERDLLVDSAFALLEEVGLGLKGSASLGALADAALHRPGLALMRAAPGLRWLSSQSLPKKVYFGAPPTSRALGPAAQYVADPASESIQSRLVPKRPQ